VRHLSQTAVYTVYVCVCVFVLVVGLPGVCVEDILLQIQVLCESTRFTLSVIVIRSKAGNRNRKFFDGERSITKQRCDWEWDLDSKWCNLKSYVTVTLCRGVLIQNNFPTAL